jgi:hypothetical protein
LNLSLEKIVGNECVNLEVLRRERRVEATALQMVGPKEWDGFAVVLVVN